MYLSSILLIFLLININLSLSLICSENYLSQSCECEDISYNGQIYIILKCTSIPLIKSNINYRTIEFEYCLNDLDFNLNPFNNITLNILRIRHCNLINLNEQSFSNINYFEKFYLENSTIKTLSTKNNNFQDIFYSNSFQLLKSLTLKNIHYHQIHYHDKKLNFELLLQQLINIHRLELINIYIDNYRYTNIKLFGKYLNYLSLTNTHQKTLIPIEYFQSLERLLIRHLPDLFYNQTLIQSLNKLKNLKYILFEHNQLKSINNLKSNTIDDIDLSSNLIEYLDEYIFENIPKLRQLTLTNNPLKSINKNSFCGIENLQRLSIHIKQKQISPLDNCLLINYPNLQIIQDSQTKFQCNCQLLNIYNIQKDKTIEINRIFKKTQVCILENKLINLYELNNYLNCSNINNNQCNRLCQDRNIKILSATLTSNINSKDSSSLATFLSYRIFLVFLCFLYL